MADGIAGRVIHTSYLNTYLILKVYDIKLSTLLIRQTILLKSSTDQIVVHIGKEVGRIIFQEGMSAHVNSVCQLKKVFILSLFDLSKAFNQLQLKDFKVDFNANYIKINYFSINNFVNHIIIVVHFSSF